MGNSNCIFYDTSSKEIREKILGEFKRIYSTKNITGIDIVQESLVRTYIRVNNYKVYFTYDPDLIDFICELNRPFVFCDKHTQGYYIRFI